MMLQFNNTARLFGFSRRRRFSLLRDMPNITKGVTGTESDFSDRGDQYFSPLEAERRIHRTSSVEFVHDTATTRSPSSYPHLEI
jgi:hypothetical protein